MLSAARTTIADVVALAVDLLQLVVVDKANEAFTQLAETACELAQLLSNTLVYAPRELAFSLKIMGYTHEVLVAIERANAPPGTTPLEISEGTIPAIGPIIDPTPRPPPAPANKKSKKSKKSKTEEAAVAEEEEAEEEEAAAMQVSPWVEMGEGERG